MSRPFRASRNLAPFPRALPWAGMSRPFRAATNFVALSVTLSPLSKAAGKAHAKARKREEWEPRIHANSREFTQNGVSGWSKRAVKSEFKRGFGVGAPHLHLVSTPCLHTLSPHFVESEGASECSGSPFASDALWSPRSPRFCGNFPRLSTPVNPIEACERQHQHCLILLHTATATSHCLLPLLCPLSPVPCLLSPATAYCHCLLPLPTATAYCYCLLLLPTATAAAPPTAGRV